MLKKLIGTTLAASLVVTSLTATPANADLDRGETTRLLLGLGALAIIASEADRRKDKRARAQQQQQQVRTVEPVNPTKRIAGTLQRQRLGHRAIPASCERRIETYNGKVRRVFGKPCLQRAGYNRSLPRQCKVIVDLPRRSIPAWTKRCLRQNGYVFN